MATEQELIHFLSNGANYTPPANSVEHLETHISHIFLAGEFAYKIKKPLNLGFLDFTTLEQRKLMIERELHLNQRYAPGIYLKTVPLYGGSQGLTFKEAGEPVEFILIMKRFDSASLFTSLLKDNRLTEDLLYEVTGKIAELHTQAEKTPSFWSYEIVSKIFNENIETLNRLGYETNSIKEALSKELEKSRALIARRQAHFVRALHGDLHLGNLCIFEGKATPFDGIEFNDEYSCIDTMADIAFLIMDLLAQDRKDSAFAVLNRYLELTDDFEGLTLLKMYIAYRSLVRAKVSALAVEEGQKEKGQDVLKYLSLAENQLMKSDSFVIAVGGTSGSGKSKLSRNLSKALGCIVIRSDAVRKHLAGVHPYKKAPRSAYEEKFTKKTYRLLLEKTRHAVHAGFHVITDAVFLSKARREEIEQCAKELGVPFYGVWCSVPIEIAQTRINKRSGDVSDATVDVMERQRASDTGTILWHQIDTQGTPEQTCSSVRKALNL